MWLRQSRGSSRAGAGPGSTSGEAAANAAAAAEASRFPTAALAHEVGYPLAAGWIVASIALYLVTGAFWLPVVWMQMRMRDLAIAADAAATTLPPAYHRLFRWWFAFGFPAFAAVMAILWLMIAKPEIPWLQGPL